MNLPHLESILSEFSSFLLEAKLSAISAKNYTSDLRHFFQFCRTAFPYKNSTEIFQTISKCIEEYTKYQKSIFTPTSSLNRRLASVRRFHTFLKSKNIFEIEQNISPSSNTTSEFSDNLSLLSKDLTTKKVLELFKNYLVKEKKTHSTVKNYLSDLYHFFSWTANKTPFTAQNLDLILSPTQLSTYTSYLNLTHTSTSVINRRTSSIKKLSHFCFLEKFIPTDPFERKVEIVKLSPVSWFRRLLPKIGKPSNAPKNRFTVIYDKYHSLPFTPYLHLALLVLATTAMAFLGYNQIIKNAKPSSAATSLTPPKRQLSFQGRLYDSSDTPITTAVNVIFKLWDDDTAGSQLYTSGTCSITPDQDGIFNTLIGDTVCGSEISQSVFADNQNVYLEVTVGAETLTPRQQIATVGYALNSETLQGYPAASPATINSVPVINNDGDILISVASPSLVSSSGNFNVEGQSLSLTTTTSSGGDIVFQPDALGSGQILALGGTTTEDTFRVTNANLTTGSLISGYVGNDTATGSGNLLLLSSGATESAKFWVTADGRTNIHTATASADTSALTINQNGTGNIFSASSSGVTKFLLNNLGAITTIDGVAHTIDDIAGNLTLTSNSSTISLNDNVTFAGTTTLNGQTYTWPGSQSTNYILSTNGSGTLSWVDPSVAGSASEYWNQSDGTIFTKNSTVDFLLGGQSTASAMFAVLNINSGTPTASISSDTVDVATFIDGNGNISTTNKQTLTLGNTPTGNVVISPGGVTALTASGANVNIAGDLTITGDDLFMNTNTSGMLLVADGTNFNPTAVSGDISINGTGVTAIGNDKITEAMLKSVNGATDEMCLSYESTVGDFEWQNCDNNVYWGQSNGALYPLNSTVDMFIGGQSTSSAMFAFLNVNSGTPTASISSDTTDVATFIDGNGNISTTNRQSLVLGNSATYNSTGNILLNPNGTGNIGIGDTTPLAMFTVGNGDLFQINSSGIIAAIDGVAHTIDDVGGNLTLTSNSSAVSVADDLYVSSGISTYSTAVSDGTVEATKFCTGDGETNCVTDFSALVASAGYWAQNNGTLYPNNSTVDLLIGGQATTSAKFAVLNMNSGTPTASIAGTVANQTTFFDGNGNISTTNRQSLVLGNSATYDSTGNILLNPNGTGSVGIGTTNPATKFEVNGKTTLAAGSTGGLKFAGLTSAIYSNGNGIGFSPQDGSIYYGAGGSLNGYSIANYVYSTTTAGLMRYAPLGGISTTTGTPGLVDFTGTFNPASGTPTNRGIYLNPTINWGGTPGAGSYEAFNISAVETSLPTGTNYLIRARAGAAGTTDEFTVTNGGLGYFAGNLGIGDASPLSAFTVGSGDLFQVNSSGIISSIDGVAHTVDDVAGNLTLTSNSTVISLNDSVTFASTTTLNGQTYTWPGSQTNNYVLSTNGSGTLSWVAQTGGASYWDQQNGSLYPLNSTVDLFIGGQATTSAKFAVLNINSGTPTASVSAGAAGAASLTATGTLATTAKQTLTLADTNTGNIDIGTDATARINTFGNTTTTTATNINSGTGDITLNSTDQIKLTSNKASGGTNTENFSIKNTTDLGLTDEVLQVGDTSDMITLLGNGNLGVGTTTPSSLLETYTASGLLTESLTNGSLTSGTSWTQSGDMALAANAATYTHSAGTGTLSQAAGTLAVPGNSNRLYSFTYTVSAVSGTAPVANITTAFAASSQTLKTDANGTYTIIFRSTNSPGAFTISVTSGAAGAFTLDDLTLKEVSGNLLTKTDGLGDQLNVFDGDNNTNLLIGDGGTTTFKPTVFDAVYSCTGASCTSGDSGTFTDSTTEAKSNSGTPYTAVGTGTTDTFYVGLDHIFNIVNFDIVTASSGLTLVAEYYNGAWTAIPQSTDNTSALTTDGTISFIAPSDWTTNAVNSTTKYWVRLRSSTNVATAPTLYFSTPTNGNRFYVYGLTGDSAPAFYISDKGMVGIGDATPDHKLDVAGNIGLDASSYINFGDTDGTSGYGFRDNSGVLEFKNSAGAWTAMGSNDWTTSNGALYPKNSTLDVFFGGQATTSAKFAFLNNNTGTPIASISANSGNIASYITGDGTFATTNRQTLTIGNSTSYNTTGNVLINPNGTGNVGIGDATPLAMFTVGSGDKFQVDSNGNIVKLNNVTTSFPSSQGAANSVLVNNGSGTLTWADPAGTGTIGYWSRSADSLYPTDTTDPIGIGFSTALSDANAMLEVDGDVLPHADFATGYNLGSASLTWNGLFVTQIAGSAGSLYIDVDGQDLEGTQWNVVGALRVGDTTNTVPSGIEFYVSGDATVSGTFGVGGKSTFIDTVTVGANGDGKIDVGTVDPPYTINGEKYATYMSGMVGVKEEVTGNIATTEYIENVGYRKLIDLDSQPKGSDIWLFAMTTEIKKNIDKLSILLTGEGQTKTWYELDKPNNILAIYSSSPTNISYRLTAPRFDSHKWTNDRTEGVTGFVINTDDNNQNFNSQFDQISNPAFLAQLDGTYKLVNGEKEIQEITTAKNSLVANLQAGAAIVADLLVDNLTIRQKLISPIADIDELKVRDATVSGTLYANNIKGTTIDRLDEQLDLLNTKYSTASAILADLQAKYGNYSYLMSTPSATETDPLALSPLATSEGELPSDLPSDILADAVFTKSVSSFDTDLYIQPSGDKPVHLLANLMTLYPDGKVLINGDLLVTGNIFASNLDTKTATVSGSLALGKGELATDSGKLIALFNDYGEVVGSIDASGSAHFDELVTPELIIAAGNTSSISTNSAEIISNASIGTASIATNSAEIFIQNNKITDNTLVYITPVSDTGNQVIYVKSKQTGSGFTVAIPQPSPIEIIFNYWLIKTK